MILAEVGAKAEKDGKNSTKRPTNLLFFLQNGNIMEIDISRKRISASRSVKGQGWIWG